MFHAFWLAKLETMLAGDSSLIYWSKYSVEWGSDLKPGAVIFNKLYLPVIRRVFLSKSVTLFQTEDITWHDQNCHLWGIFAKGTAVIFFASHFRQKIIGSGMCLCNSLNWKSVSLVLPVKLWCRKIGGLFLVWVVTVLKPFLLVFTWG